MNRHDRRRAEAQHRAYETRLRKDAEVRELKQENSLPADIKLDIAKTVRSIEWTLADRQPAGMCLFRAMSGAMVLNKLDISAKPALGGMIYRTGPDERRDVVAFCGRGNAGEVIGGHFVGHYFVVSGTDIVDFSVGDWKALTAPGVLSDIEVERGIKLGPIQWTTPDPPEFFWGPRESFEPIAGQYTPDLGHAYYTGFAGAGPNWDTLFEDLRPQMSVILPHIDGSFEFFALKERVWAHRNGHTAVRMSRLAEMVTDQDLAARARQFAAASQLQDQLIVTRGKDEITPATAAEILAEALARDR